MCVASSSSRYLLRNAGTQRQPVAGLRLTCAIKANDSDSDSLFCNNMKTFMGHSQITGLFRDFFVLAIEFTF